MNSGAGSAAYDASTVNGYQNLTEFWSAYRAHTTARAGATYSAVGGSGFATNSDYTDYAVYDAYTANGAKIPYIIRAYTQISGTAYLARCITTASANVVTVSSNCVVAQGFRGIGSIYYNSTYLRLGISKMTGRIGETQTSYQITLNMRYLEYNHKSVSKYIAVYSTSNEESTAGFGLFTRMDMSSPDSDNSVQYLTLSGKVFYDVYTIGGAVAAYNFVSYTSKNDRTETGPAASDIGDENVTLRSSLLSVGGIAGFVNKQFYIRNVTFNDFYVEGAKTAGGLIGFIYGAKSNGVVSSIVYDNENVVNAGFINVVGGLQAGGFIGRIVRAAVHIDGGASGKEVIIRNIESKNGNPDETGLKYYANLNTGVGGLVGTCWAADSDGNESPTLTPAASIQVRSLFVNGIKLVKGTNDANVRVLNDSGTKNNYAGGFVGSAHNVWLKIENSGIRGVNVTANAAGGFVGKVSQKYFLYISGCSADGLSKASTISGTRYAGGAVGWAIGRDTLYFQMLNVAVTDYVIKSTATGAVQAGAGGLVGYAQGDNKSITENSNYICEFNNLKVSGCDIETNYTNKTDDYLKYKCGTGGLIGVIDTATNGVESSRNSNNKYKFSGYNILVENCILKHLNGGTSNDNTSATNRRIGDLVGNNAVSSPMKLVGVAVRNATYCGKHVGYFSNDNDNYGSGGTYGTGYAVFANFNAAGGNETTFGNVKAGDSDDYVNVDSNVTSEPYVTVNPCLTVGGITITGDGVATTVAGLPINNILADASGLYKYATNYYYNGSNGETNKAAFNSFSGKIVLFSSEVSGYLGQDFPVLIVDDSTPANSHKLINSYIRLLTNTRHDFGQDKSGEYTVKIYNMVYENSVLTPSLTGASLKRDDNMFYMTNANFDSGKTQFSLIDVRFLDPADTSKVAYHLYIPVFVKKVLSYDFDIAVRSGTTYIRSTYSGVFGQPLIENIGTPVTFYFEYEYSRNASEWASFINSGENVNRNYTKSLLFYKANTNEQLKAFPDSTVLVLVDPNRGGKPYYATIKTALSGNTLNLSAFKETMTVGNEGYVFGGESFSPVTLGSLMTLSVTSEGENRNMVAENDPASATVVVSGQGYRLATDEEKADGTVTKYRVIVSGSISEERYYLSVFTESNALNDELFHYYLVTSPTSFDDPLYPSKIADTGSETMVHLVMGKIFYHNNFAVSSSSKKGAGVTFMSNENNVLTVNLTSVLGLSDDLDDDIKTNVQSLIAATEVYQSFIVYLERTEAGEISKAVLSSPEINASYAVDTVLNGSADVVMTAYGNGNGSINDSTQNYVEVVSADLSANFASGNKFEINATVTLTYTAAGVLTQFPGRGPTTQGNGVTVSGSSNIAFSASGTAYSKNSISGEELPVKSYYSEAESGVSTLDLNPLGDKLGDFTALGINANNNGNSDTAEFDLLAVMNIASLNEQILAYDHAEISVSLYCKNDLGNYGDNLTVSDYFSLSLQDVNGGDITEETSGNGTVYQVDVDDGNDYYIDNGAEIMLPTMHFTVKTGTSTAIGGGGDFENNDFVYSNYRIVVEVVLCKANGDPISETRVTNYVVYTNAKVNPSFIKAH